MDVKVKFKGGGSITTCPPEFSEDGEFIYISWKNAICCYHTKTAKLIRKLKGLQHNVVGFNLLKQKDKESIFACSVTGEIISWNVDESYATVKSKMPLKDIIVKKFHSVLWNKMKDTQKQLHLLSWTLKKSQDNILSVGLFDMSDAKLREIKLTLENGNHDIAIGGSENPFFAIVQGRKLYFGRLSEGKHIYKRKIHGRNFTRVACHPQEECVLTGDDTGRILIWHGLARSAPTQAVYHWHNVPVKTVCFSSSGSCFFSGAEECVLVKWNIGNSNQRHFLPRLSSSIEQITVAKDNTLLAVTTSDNIVHVLDFRLERVSTIQHLVLGRNFPAGIQFDPRSGALVLNGIVGHLQFYSPREMALIYNLDIIGQNKLTRERECNIGNTDVVKVALDNGGKWLASVEERHDSNGIELRLKFWLFSSNEQSYTLNSSVELPHEDSIHDISFQPCVNNEDVRCVTVGADRKFKIWEVTSTDNVYKKGVKWTCSAVGFYKDLACNCLAFSSDGSVFAVSFDFTVTIWETDTCQFKYSLSCPQIKSQVTHVKFGAAKRCHLMVSTTTNHAVLWNLLTLSTVWIVNVNVSLLVGNIYSSYMAIFTEDNRVIVFDPNNPAPIYTKKLKSGKALTAGFIPHPASVDSEKDDWCCNSQLYYIDSNQELYCFERSNDEEEAVEIIEAENKSLFNATIPKLKSGYQKKELADHKINRYTDIKKIREFLDVPVNIMAPIHLTCGNILKLLVETNKNTSETR